MNIPNPTSRDLAALAPLVDDAAPLSAEGKLLEAAYDSLGSAYDEVATERRRVRLLRSKLRAAKWLLAIAWIAAAFCAGALVRIAGGGL